MSNDTTLRNIDSLLQGLVAGLSLRDRPPVAREYVVRYAPSSGGRFRMRVRAFTDEEAWRQAEARHVGHERIGNVVVEPYDPLAHRGEGDAAMVPGHSYPEPREP